VEPVKGNEHYNSVMLAQVLVVAGLAESYFFCTSLVADCRGLPILTFFASVLFRGGENRDNAQRVQVDLSTVMIIWLSPSASRSHGARGVVRPS